MDIPEFMKNVVIIAEYFAPLSVIASIRPTKLAKYFKVIAGYNITVITRKPKAYETIDPILEQDLGYVDNIVYTAESLITKCSYSIFGYINYNQNIRASKTGKLRIHRKVMSHIAKYIGIGAKLLAERGFVKSATKYAKKNRNQYDVIFSTRSPYNNHVIGKTFKNYNRKALWIADFRDPMITSRTPVLHKWFFFGKTKLVRNADIITGVTHACIQEFEKDYQDRLHIITNGFDKDDLKSVDENTSNKFTLVYTGTLHKGRSDFGAVFHTISELISEGKIDKSKLGIEYAGSNSQCFIEQSSRYGLSDIILNHGYVSRTKTLQMQKSSSILLLATWNSIGNTGIITGKFLEYLMVDKPIICTVTGNLAYSETKEMIEKARCGIVWEEANSDADYVILKGYILKQYELYINNQSLAYNPNEEYIEQFNYKNIAQQFIDLVEKDR